MLGVRSRVSNCCMRTAFKLIRITVTAVLQPVIPVLVQCYCVSALQLLFVRTNKRDDDDDDGTNLPCTVDK